MANKYQNAYLKLLSIFNAMQLGIYEHSTLEVAELFDTIQELVDREKPLTPTYKNTYIEYKEHYLDKDYKMLYHCPKCDSVVYPIGRCTVCHQNLDWNKYFVIEGRSYHSR